jgi:lysophospholipase L1-like esterase
VRPILFRAVALLLAFSIVEVGVRLFSVPFSGPRILFYGTHWHRTLVVAPGLRRDVGALSEETEGGYWKYEPHEEKWARDARGSYRVQINNHGLRGPDFDVAKRPGVLRVITLGASSTFGFENRDDETYPYYVQQMLDRDAGPGRFEVINFGVPHIDSDQIVGLFRAEGVELRPDVVTIYEGVNDSKVAILDDVYGSVWTRLGKYLLAVELLRNLGNAAFPSVAPVVIRQAAAEYAAAHYVRNLEAIAAECRRVGARLIVVTQQMRSLLIEREQLHGVTYDDEVAFAKQAVEEAGAAGAKGYNALQLSTGAMLVVHSYVTKAVRTWAASEHVPLVDGIALLDGDRDLILTWVHLAPAANESLARAIAAEIRAVTSSAPRA